VRIASRRNQELVSLLGKDGDDLLEEHGLLLEGLLHDGHGGLEVRQAPALVDAHGEPCLRLELEEDSKLRAAHLTVFRPRSGKAARGGPAQRPPPSDNALAEGDAVRQLALGDPGGEGSGVVLPSKVLAPNRGVLRRQDVVVVAGGGRGSRRSFAVVGGVRGEHALLHAQKKGLNPANSSEPSVYGSACSVTLGLVEPAAEAGGAVSAVVAVLQVGVHRGEDRLRRHVPFDLDHPDRAIGPRSDGRVEAAPEVAVRRVVQRSPAAGNPSVGFDHDRPVVREEHERLRDLLGQNDDGHQLGASNRLHAPGESGGEVNPSKGAVWK
jgi:hypothetical protein